MITKRFKTPRGLHEDRPFYGFYVRVSGESLSLLKDAVAKATDELSAHPSNPVLLDHLLTRFLADGQKVAAR